MNIHGVADLAEFLRVLKTQHGDSNDSLGAKIGIGGTTVHRILQGYNVDDKTLDKLAAYAKIPREQIYELAKGVQYAERKYSRVVTAIAEMLEQAEPEIQELFLVQVRAVLQNREKSSTETS
jgi:transcriptional regulator with XRE-family HTH domain